MNLREHIEKIAALAEGVDGRINPMWLRRALAEADDAPSALPEGRADGRAAAVAALMAARDAARANWRTAVNDNRGPEVERHWSATAGWLLTRAEAIEAGQEPDWPDAATLAAPVVAVPEAGEVVHALMMQGGERLPLCGEPQPVHRWAGLTTNPNEVTCPACLGVPEAGERETTFGPREAGHAVWAVVEPAPVVGEQEEKP